MALLSDNATAPYLVFGWDGTVAGIEQGFDNAKEAEEWAAARKSVAPDHVDYYSGTQDEVRAKVAELTGAPIEMLTDATTTLPKTAVEEAPTASY